MAVRIAATSAASAAARLPVSTRALSAPKCHHPEALKLGTNPTTQATGPSRRRISHTQQNNTTTEQKEKGINAKPEGPSSRGDGGPTRKPSGGQGYRSSVEEQLGDTALADAVRVGISALHRTKEAWRTAGDWLPVALSTAKVVTKSSLKPVVGFMPKAVKDAADLAKAAYDYHQERSQSGYDSPPKPSGEGTGDGFTKGDNQSNQNAHPQPNNFSIHFGSFDQTQHAAQTGRQGHTPHTHPTQQQFSQWPSPNSTHAKPVSSNQTSFDQTSRAEERPRNEPTQKPAKPHGQVIAGVEANAHPNASSFSSPRVGVECAKAAGQPKAAVVRHLGSSSVAVSVPFTPFRRAWTFIILAVRLFWGTTLHRVKKIFRGGKPQERSRETPKVVTMIEDSAPDTQANQQHQPQPKYTSSREYTSWVSRETKDQVLDQWREEARVKALQQNAQHPTQQPTQQTPTQTPVRGAVVSLAQTLPRPASLNEENLELLVDTMCRLRGTALKLAQMLSIQDSSTIPDYLLKALQRVRDSAHFMPQQQLEGVLNREWGQGWVNRFAEFDMKPIAAASLGQVHRARLHDGRIVAVKVQYPGIAEAIDSDVQNLGLLFRLNLLPKGLFVDNVLAELRRELKEECDYILEAKKMQKFAAHLAKDQHLRNRFAVPTVIDDLTRRHVLTMTWAEGTPIDKVQGLSQGQRDLVGAALMRLTLTELFNWRLMQTDPNWSNFFVDTETGTLNLLDFGATRSYDATFVGHYAAVVGAARKRDQKTVVDHSVALGFLTGLENKEMVKAHCESTYIIGEPFGTPEAFDFHAANVPLRLSAHVGTMLKHRLKPPPTEVYSLHRRLSGLYLTLGHLRARVVCQPLFDEVMASMNDNNKK